MPLTMNSVLMHSVILYAHFHSIVDLVFGFEQPSYTFSESVGVANLGVRLSSESGILSMPLVFTFTTGDGSAIGKCRKTDLLIILTQVLQRSIMVSYLLLTPQFH